MRITVGALGTANRRNDAEIATDTLLLTYEDAEKLCEDRGERLCESVAEMESCCGRGCNHDQRLVWISASCESGERERRCL